MGRDAAFRGEEHRQDAAHAALCIKGAQRGEAHAVLEKDDLAHGQHLRVQPGRGETMKCRLFRGDA